MLNGNDSTPPVLSGGVARQVFWRCLGLQASWNEQRLQNLGLLVCLAPWLRGQALDRQALRGACRRYFGFFNTNPYLAGLVVGGLLRLEHDRARGLVIGERHVSGMRDTLARACGGLGDQLVWLGLRPALMMGACLAALGGRWEVVLDLVAVFTVGQLWWRWRTLRLGYARGLGLVDVLGRPAWHRTIAALRAAALLLTGVVIGVYFAGVLGFGDAGGAGRWLAIVCAGLALPALVRQMISAEVQLVIGLAIMILLALVLP